MVLTLPRSPRCFTEKPAEELLALPCGHQHCLPCWEAYFEARLLLGGSFQPLSCLSPCKQMIDDDLVHRLLLNNPRLLQHHGPAEVDIFVKSSQATKWCPGPDCTAIVRLAQCPSDMSFRIDCDACRSVFCFQCLEPWHEPVQCSLLRRWEQMKKDEHATHVWLLKSSCLVTDRIGEIRLIFIDTRECPRCRSRIDRPNPDERVQMGQSLL